ncbi:MAG: hypothetical protein Q9198_002351 [Flavoplaca austrocitrina]
MKFWKCAIVAILHQAFLQPSLAKENLAILLDNSPNLGRVANCYPRRSIATAITTVSDCGLSVREMISEGSHAADPVKWGPGIDRYLSWAWGTCGILLIPNSPQSFDTFSRLKLAEAVTRLVSECGTEAHGYKGGTTKFGPKGVFTLAVNGRPRRPNSGLEEE